MKSSRQVSLWFFLFLKRLHSHVEYYVSGGSLEKGKKGKKSDRKKNS